MHPCGPLSPLLRALSSAFHIPRSGSRTAATSKMECFVIIVKGWYSSWYSFSVEVPFMAPAIYRKAWYWKVSNFRWKAKLHAWSYIMPPRSRWGYTKNLEVLSKGLWNFPKRLTVLLSLLRGRRNSLQK